MDFVKSLIYLVRHPRSLLNVPQYWTTIVYSSTVIRTRCGKN